MHVPSELPASIAPPRTITLWAKLSLMHRGSSHFALFLIGLGLFIGLIVFALLDRTSEHFRDDFPRVVGTITEIEHPPTSRRETVWYNYHYRYQVAGKQYQGIVRHPARLDLTEVSVQYVPDAPGMARVDGLGNPGMSDWALTIPGLFFALALYYLVRGWRATLDDIRLIRECLFTTATAQREGKEAVLHFTTSAGEQWQYRPLGDTRKLKPGTEWPVCYVPGHPEQTELVERLEPRITKVLMSSGKSAPV